MTPQELKNSILQLAIQGKLVEQRPEEGTAKELFVRIQEEKLRLIAEKKIKKEKPLPEITEDEKTFDIPESWMWVRWGDLSESIQYGYNAPAQSTGRIKMVRISDIQEGKVLWETVPFCNIQEDEIPNYLLKKNDILFARTGGTVGKSYLVKDVPNESIYAGYLIRTRYSESLCPEYMKYFMESSLYWTQLKNGTIATAQPNCNGKTLSKMVLPLPPLAEQKRIVAKIEELLPYIDRYEQAWSKLEQFNSRFPEDMKKSLLQYAIQGKLVEQRPEEGTAEELFARIQEEKQRLIAEKKIKREKPLPEITEDEKLFDIPESWKWVRVGDIFAHNTGKAMNSTAKKVDKPGSVKRFITTSNLYWNSFDLSSVKEMFFSDDELERCTVTKGDLLMCEGGAYYGRTAIWNYDYDICFQNHVHRLRPYQAVTLLFFYHLFYFYKSMNMMNAKGTAMPGLSSQTLHQMVVPLPPLSEQKRIVEKLEQLLPLCERLK
ncbi:restriction endonuclease subunit S [bacterium 210917-SL.2.15]|nr:restriction endonuclease subunit S [bacterium 210917-SL.2.15]